MIVYHFNTFLDGGAGGAARSLHESLIRNGVSSRFYHSRMLSAPDDVSYRKFGPVAPEFTWTRRITDRLNGNYFFRKNYQKKLDHYLTNRPEGFERFDFVKLPYETMLEWNGEKPDLIHLHWVSSLIDYPSFFASLPEGIPIVWTLHDMNPFTGGCHYAWECTGYRTECGNCPQLNENRSQNDISHSNWNIKWEILRNKTLHVVAASNWLKQCAEESKLFANAKSFRTIHYGIDLKSFAPKSKEDSRRALSIDPNSFVVAFGAESVDNRRKGSNEFYAALSKLAHGRITCLVFGDGSVPPAPQSNVQMKPLGRAGSPELLTLIYSASDVFVMPSLFENLGQMALESLACETPVVAFRVGGNSDIVRPVTGLLADPVTPEKLAEKIQWMHDNPTERLEMGRNGRMLIEQEFSLDVQARKYLELYKDIVRR